MLFYVFLHISFCYSSNGKGRKEGGKREGRRERRREEQSCTHFLSQWLSELLFWIIWWWWLINCQFLWGRLGEGSDKDILFLNQNDWAGNFSGLAWHVNLFENTQGDPLNLASVITCGWASSPEAARLQPNLPQLPGHKQGPLEGWQHLEAYTGGPPGAGVLK